MISGIFRGVARCLASATPFALVLVASGCDPEGYPADLKYPVRSDIIILTPNPDEVYHPEPPGKLDISLASYKQLAADGKKVEAVDPAQLSGADRAAIAASLEKHFGTPSKPLVKIDPSEDEDTNNELNAAFSAAELQLDDKTLAAGSVLYRRNCQHCHGVSGNGRGPTAPWLHPHPRDYRKGKFKFISSGSERGIPSRDDLHRVLKNGIDYTSMPSFGLLEDEKLDELVSYVIHLSLRGQAEEETMVAAVNKKLENSDHDTISADAFLQDKVRDMVRGAGGWAVSNRPGSVLTPAVAPSADDKTRASDIEKGYKFFIGDGGCLKCHKDFGRQSLYRYDAWGTQVQPRNLTAGMYRGGRRPIDFYWRIRNGIQPSTMPKVDYLLTEEQKNMVKPLEAQVDKETGARKRELQAQLHKKKTEFTEPNIWPLVAFIQAVPYPNMLPESVRKVVYPTPVIPVPVAKQD